MPTLRINEIFYSIQGESSRIGRPTVFVRLTGCPMRCTYCDTAYAFHAGQQQEIDEIIQEIQKFDTNYVTVTGGEPLAQKNCIELMNQLCALGYQVSLETGGGLDIKDVNSQVKIILDVKTPKSNEDKNNFWPNLANIKTTDEIKFVIQDYDDFSWSIDIIKQYQLNQQQILFSPVYKVLASEQLAEWILKHQLNVRLQLQLHKILWGEKQGV
ncbi:MAG: 7-carboxy-7-deazaguanine synthase QueE [Methylophilaceae bacterium]|jgi:7-carboxy-7-deazaguanine synthase|nr:7-carboxy-7-deazaguanine synthase QueE [Methylophilaceae bacterium]NCV38620.1 7-carboxy-7-deazaguanine synthase QueE [Betaproteobacteria bacterium]NCV53421.1 7-carboxy-7-deazaguanine synthase QueE [Betaproteobacteria bacterium]NCX68490.1 7-carboxy-7-deazaguanine synthase QueE [Betaproteobacteria bacterium]